MSDRLTLRGASQSAMRGQLRPGLLSEAVMTETFCFQFLGITEDSRILFYSADDGTLHTHTYDHATEELTRENIQHIGRHTHSKTEDVDAFTAAYLHLTETGTSWAFTHPRFRWLEDYIQNTDTSGNGSTDMVDAGP